MEANPFRQEDAKDSAILLRRLVAECHSLLLYDNAVFLAERLLAVDWGIEAAYWVAQSYFLQNDHSRLFHFLKPLHPFGTTFPMCNEFSLWHWKLLHLWGVCCVKLHKYQDAEIIFTQQMESTKYSPSPAELAAHHYYLGLVARRVRNNQGATQHFIESLSHNPFLFSAFEEACTMGHAPHFVPAQVFSATSSTQYFEEQLNLSLSGEEEGGRDDPMGMESAEEQRLSSTGILTRSATKSLNRRTTTTTKPGSQSVATGSRRIKVHPYPSVIAPPRRAMAVEVSTQPYPSPSRPSSNEMPTIAGVQYLLQLLALMGEAYRLLCLYKCPQSIQALQQLPQLQQDTGWALSLLGKAYVELADYSAACETFAHLRLREPHRLEGMVEYSTALYQLKRDKELSALAQSMAEQDRHSAYSLCVLANCFSLAGDHEGAIRFLKRASKQMQFMWYTHTLLGHEHFFMDDVDEALQQYRHAMLINPLHFNAWYGMGTVYMKQEQFAQAQHYFSVAIRINGNSSPLYVHLATTLQSQEKHREALENLQVAINVQPSNLLARLKRAQLNLSLNKLNEAMQELEFLRDKAPKEAQICITLGKCYQRMGLLVNALRYFNLALDLEPKKNPIIKRYMEQCMQGASDAP